MLSLKYSEAENNGEYNLASKHLTATAKGRQSNIVSTLQ